VSFVGPELWTLRAVAAAATTRAPIRTTTAAVRFLMPASRENDVVNVLNQIGA
jgi:hypothetical protein